MRFLVLLAIAVVAAAVSLPSYLLDRSVARSYEYFGGGKYIADSNYSRIIDNIKGEGLAILFTLRACLSCYANEPQLALIISSLQSHNITVNRCELQSNPELQKRFKIVRFPYLVLLRNDSDVREYRYRGLMLASRVQLFVDAILSPVFQLREELSVEQVADHIFSRHQRPESLVVYVCTSNDEPEHMIKLFRELAGAESAGQTRFLVVSNPNTARQLKQEYPQWFDVDARTLIYFRFTTRSEWFVRLECDYDDLEATKTVLQDALLGSVQELTHELYKVAASSSKPVFVCLIDSAYRTEDAQFQLNILENVLMVVRNEVRIFWVEGSVNPDKRKILAIPTEQPPPALALLDFAAAKLENVYQGRFEREAILKFINTVLGRADTKEKVSSLLLKLWRLSRTLKYLRPTSDADELPQLQSSTTTKPNASNNLLIICLERLVQSNIDAIALIANRLFRLFYKQVEVLLFVGQRLQFEGRTLSQGVHYWHAAANQLTTLDVALQCDSVFNALLKWLHLPLYPCVPEGQLHEYLLRQLS